MEDFEEALSARLASPGSGVFAAAEMQLAISGEVVAGGVKKIRHVTATEEMYERATSPEEQENEDHLKSCSVTAFLRGHSSLTAKGSAFCGRINSKQARELYIDVVQKWSNDEGLLAVPLAKGQQVFQGFEGYPGSLGDHDLQKFSSAVMNKSWLSRQCENR